MKQDGVDDVPDALGRGTSTTMMLMFLYPTSPVPTITHMHAFAAAQSGTGRPAHVASWARMHVHGSSPNISEEQIDECTYASAAVHGEQFAFAHRQEEEWGKRRPFGLLTQV
jgi:hypothetical protein